MTYVYIYTYTYSMIDRFKLVWFLSPRYNSTNLHPEFRACGLALQNVQFCYRNYVGTGAPTKPKAVWNWLTEIVRFIRA